MFATFDKPAVKLSSCAGPKGAAWVPENFLVRRISSQWWIGLLPLESDILKKLSGTH